MALSTPKLQRKPKRQVNRQAPYTDAQKRVFEDEFDPERTGAAIKKDRALNPRGAHQQLKAVVDALDCIDWHTKDLPAHERIARLHKRLVRLERALVANVKVKTRLRRELERMKGGGH